MTPLPRHAATSSLTPTHLPAGTAPASTPYSSIQETVDRHEADWGQVFLQPGLYRENVDIHRGRLWIFPAQQYGVELDGAITVRRPGDEDSGH